MPEDKGERYGIKICGTQGHDSFVHFPVAEIAHKPTEQELLLQSREGPRDFQFLFSVVNEVSVLLTPLSWFCQGILRSQVSIPLHQTEGEAANNLSSKIRKKKIASITTALQIEWHKAYQADMPAPPQRKYWERIQHGTLLYLKGEREVEIRTIFLSKCVPVNLEM